MCNVDVRDIAYSYGEREIFQHVNISLAGGFVSVIGPNGAGKSTLMKVLSGLYKPRTGKVRIHQQPVHQLNSLQRARIFTTIHQQPKYNFPYTSMEIVSHGRYAISKTKYLSGEDYKVIVDVMKSTDTLAFRDQAITKLSGGEQQRVVLATALAQEPKLLFIDEGFSALDIHHKTKMLGLLKGKADRGELMVIAIMHDLNMAYHISDQVIRMSRTGSVVTGTPEVVMDKEALSDIYDVDFHQGMTESFHVKI